MDGYGIFASIASPAVALALVKWALVKYETQAHDLEEERKENILSEIRQLRTLCHELSTKIERVGGDFLRLDKDFAVMVEKLKFGAGDVDKMLVAFRGFVESTGKRFSDIETKVAEISKDVFRVSTRKKGD
jgi:hypothetical protein